MTGKHPPQFQREQGFEAADWQRCLPGAMRGAAIDWAVPGQATVPVGAGRLVLRWQVLPPRQIALVRMPRLAVHYNFEGTTPAERDEFMRYFDLNTMRGGG